MDSASLNDDIISTCSPDPPPLHPPAVILDSATLNDPGADDELSVGGKGPAEDAPPAADGDEFSLEEVDDPELELEDGDGSDIHLTVQSTQQPSAPKDYYFQKYKTEWEELPEFRGWLSLKGL